MKQHTANSGVSPLREARTKAILAFFQCWTDSYLDQCTYRELAERGFSRKEIQESIDDLCANQQVGLESCADGLLRVKCLSKTS